MALEFATIFLFSLSSSDGLHITFEWCVIIVQY